MHNPSVKKTTWIDQWLNQSSSSGDPTRRSIEDVRKLGSDDELKTKASEKGWCVIATKTHYVLIPDGAVIIFSSP